MSITTKERSRMVTELLNGTLSSIKSVVPIEYHMRKLNKLEQGFQLYFGVLIGITGDLNGKLVLTGKKATFGFIAKEMFGTSLEGEMLVSFSGELGNMIAGGLSTNIAKSGTVIDITSPTIMQGDTTLTGFNQAIEVTGAFENIGSMYTYLLLD